MSDRAQALPVSAPTGTPSIDPASPPAVPRRARRSCGSACSAKVFHRRSGKRPAPQFVKSQPIMEPIRDPRERVRCAQLAKLRRCLRLGVVEFARAGGVTSSRIAVLEDGLAAWRESELTRLGAALDEMLSAMQAGLDEAVAIRAELEDERAF